MNKKSKVIGMLLAVCILVISSNVAVFADTDLSDKEVNPRLAEKAVELLYDGYSQYYDFLSYSTTLMEKNEMESIVEEIFYLDVNAVLIAERVEDLDYYRGVQAYVENATVELCAYDLSEDMEDEYVQILEDTQEEIYNNLSQHIGEEQSLGFYVKGIYNIENQEEVTVLFENGIEYVEVEELYPVNSATLQERGYSVMECTSNDAVAVMVEKQERATTGVTYSNSSAVAYATTYTSNPSSCNLHTNCGNRVDTTKYNSSYTNYASSHSDCANYMSQCLYAGGIPSDSTWYPGSTAWINVSALCNYMVNQGYWIEVSYSAPPVGTYMRYTSQSHIVMLSSHDGVTYKYSGHTNDRLNVVISLSSSNKYYFINTSNVTVK